MAAAVPMVYVRCDNCRGTGVRPGRSLAELSTRRETSIAFMLPEIQCPVCAGTGKDKRRRSDFDAATAAEMESVR